jgi:iron-sulfur cluster repair protein YtfE (RIC family)
MTQTRHVFTSESSTGLAVAVMVHDAIRRDLRNLARAVASAQAAADPALAPPGQAGWEILERQMRNHHADEDRSLWPRIRARLTPQSAATEALDAAEAEHERLDPLVAQVDRAFAGHDAGHDGGQDGGRAGLAAAVASLAAEANAHLEHEERDVLPLMAEVLTPDDWKAFVNEQRQALGMKGAAEFFPWLLEDASPENAQGVLDQLPPPLRMVYRRIWRPRYESQRRWS